MRQLTIGEKLKIIRNRYHLKAYEVAQELYISGAALSRYENDIGDITISKLEMLCNYYGIKLKDFFDDEFWKGYSQDNYYSTWIVLKYKREDTK